MKPATWLVTLLHTLERAIPPPSGHHALMAMTDGGQLRLALAVHLRPRVTQVVYLDDADLEKPIDALVHDILTIIPPDVDAGTGVGHGQTAEAPAQAERLAQADDRHEVSD